MTAQPSAPNGPDDLADKYAKQITYLRRYLMDAYYRYSRNPDNYQVEVVDEPAIVMLKLIPTGDRDLLVKAASVRMLQEVLGTTEIDQVNRLFTEDLDKRNDLIRAILAAHDWYQATIYSQLYYDEGAYTAEVLPAVNMPLFKVSSLDGTPIWGNTFPDIVVPGFITQVEVAYFTVDGDGNYILVML